MKSLPRKEAWREYQHAYDKEFWDYILQVLKYLAVNFNTGEVRSTEHLAFMLDELAAMYEALAIWCAKRKSEINGLEAKYDVQKAEQYIAYKEKGETNETAREKSKLDTKDLKQEILEAKKALYMIDALRKAVARYLDGTRSQLSLEKANMSYLGGRQG